MDKWTFIILLIVGVAYDFYLLITSNTDDELFDDNNQDFWTLAATNIFFVLIIYVIFKVILHFTCLLFALIFACLQIIELGLTDALYFKKITNKHYNIAYNSTIFLEIIILIATGCYVVF